MKTVKIPMRTCVVTREKYPKKELLRIVRTPDGEVLVDVGGRSNGRGAYVKKDLQVIEKAEKSKCLERILEVEIPNSIYEEVKKLIMEESR